MHTFNRKISVVVTWTVGKAGKKEKFCSDVLIQFILLFPIFFGRWNFFCVITASASSDLLHQARHIAEQFCKIYSHFHFPYFSMPSFPVPFLHLGVIGFYTFLYSFRLLLHHCTANTFFYSRQSTNCKLHFRFPNYMPSLLGITMLFPIFQHKTSPVSSSVVGLECLFT